MGVQNSKFAAGEGVLIRLPDSAPEDATLRPTVSSWASSESLSFFLYKMESMIPLHRIGKLNKSISERT
jgi:hypothetical protein